MDTVAAPIIVLPATIASIMAKLRAFKLLHGFAARIYVHGRWVDGSGTPVVIDEDRKCRVTIKTRCEVLVVSLGAEGEAMIDPASEQHAGGRVTITLKERDDARQARAAASLKAKREARLAQRKAMLDEAGATLRVIAPDGAAVPVATLAAHLKRSVASVRATVRLAARAGLVSLDGDLVRMCDATP